MKLAASQLSIAPKIDTCYEQILRAIGQALELLCVQAFDLEVDGDNYLVRGESETSKKRKVPETRSVKNALRNFWNKSPTQTSTRTARGNLSSSFVFLGMRFAQEDIDRLERQGQALRASWERSPNAHTLSQILRTVGAHVDHKRGRLLRVSKRSQWVTVCYKGPFGGERIERFTQSNLYDFWVHMYKQRKQPTGMRRNGTTHRGS